MNSTNAGCVSPLVDVHVQPRASSRTYRVYVGVTRRLVGIAEGKIVPPNPRIAVPAMQALVYSVGEEHIRDMFANLLAADMNID